MATPHSLERPQRRERVIQLVVSGLTDREIAQAIATPRLTFHHTSIVEFRQRHAAEIEARKQSLVKALEHRWISDKDTRLGKLEEIYGGLDEVRTTYGFMVTTEEEDEQGKRTIYTQHFNGALAAQLRGVLSDAGDLMGQKPKPPDANVNVNVGVSVGLAWADGGQA